MKHLNIRISGRVQGVFFRAATKAKASELGIHGIVRNEPDGTVYAEAEGDETHLKPFLDWLRKGPPGAGVEDVSTEDDVLRNYTDFRIRY